MAASVSIKSVWKMDVSKDFVLISAFFAYESNDRIVFLSMMHLFWSSIILNMIVIILSWSSSSSWQDQQARSSNDDNRQESIIAREIRETLQREAELLASRRSRDQHSAAVTSPTSSSDERHRQSDIIFTFDTDTTASRSADSFYRDVNSSSNDSGILLGGSDSMQFVSQFASQFLSKIIKHRTL